MAKASIILLICLAPWSWGRDHLSLPLSDGEIGVEAYVDVPELFAKISDYTSFGWKNLKIQFDFGVLCANTPHQWTLTVTTAVDLAGTKQIVESIPDLVGKVKGCETEIIKARLISAERIPLTGGTVSNINYEGTEKGPVDLMPELLRIRDENIAKAKQAAMDAARRAEERRKAQAAAGAKAKAEADEAARAAEQRRRIRADCQTIYKNTVDKKLKDLTVGEEQQVRACQALGLYPPQ